MDPTSLAVFLAVAEQGSVTRAAAQLGRAPSNVTTRVQQLEAELGAALFVRAGKRMRLTGAGERLQGYALRLLALADEARQVVGGAAGTLRLGTMESTAASRLPAVLAAFHQAWPEIRLEVRTGTSQALRAQVLDGRLDAAFVAPDPASDDDTEPELAGRPAWCESLILLLPAHEDAVRAQDVRTRSLAAFAPGCAYRAMAERALGAGEDATWRIQEMGSYHAMIAAVAAGACVTLLPQSVLGLSPVPASLPRLPIARSTTHLVWRADGPTPAVQRFTEALLAHGELPRS